MIHRQDGFSLLEAVIAVALMLLVTASVFQMLNPGHGSYAAEPETADMQQRLRVGADTMSKDLLMAGAGAYLGTQVGSLSHYFAPVLPFRQGAVGDDAPGTFATDRITVIYVPSTTAQTTLAADLTGNLSAPTLSLAAETDCPLNPATGVAFKECGFAKNMSVLLFDDTGNYDMFEITSLSDATAEVVVNRPPDAAHTTYKAGTTKVVEAVSHTYYLKTDTVNQVYQLMHYDGTTHAGVPVVDNVVGLSFEYFGEPQPPVIRNPTDAASSWKTTYGPTPTGGVANCIFDAAVPPVPQLVVLGGGAPGLVPLAAGQLTDGPWCPNVANANRWDADLLRIRNVSVTVRLQSANASLRGPAGALFTYGGTSRGGIKWVPDQEIRFSVSPRNLNLGR